MINEILMMVFSIVAGVLLGMWMTKDFRKTIADTSWEQVSNSTQA